MSSETLLQMQRRLMQVEGSLARLLNHLPGMAYRCRVSDNFEYTLEFVSKGSETLLGRKADDILDNPANLIERMMVDGDLPLVRKMMHDAIISGTSYELFYRLVMPQGNIKWIWDQGDGVLDERGRCVYIEGIIMDVTDQKNREQSLLEENQHLRSSIKNAYGLGNIVGKSEAMQNVYSLMLKAAGSGTNVILYGETGSGKDMAARTIHELSGVQGRYVPVNCSAIPDQLLESEFFGYIKGAFSGAVSNHAGYLAAAHEGTLFLDEIAELPLRLQAKLLRALESKTYTPVGSSEVKRSNFRLICATNQDLQEMVRRRELRADFFYRIHVLAIQLPPLRSRLDDIPLLIDAYAKQRGIVKPVPASVRLAMEQYTWPGNVRELQNALDRFWAFGDTGIDFGTARDGFICMPVDTPLAESARSHARSGSPSLRVAKGEMEKHRILAALDQHNWKRGAAATALGITMRTLQRKVKQYGIAR